jgi:hypothetical protein
VTHLEAQSNPNLLRIIYRIPPPRPENKTTDSCESVAAHEARAKDLSRNNLSVLM